jgi:hypothetical protein
MVACILMVGLIEKLLKFLKESVLIVEQLQ